METKRILIATVLCIGILFGWMKFFPAQPPRVVEPVGSGTATVPSPNDAPAAAAAGGAAAGLSRQPEQLVTLETADAVFSFSTWGGTLRQVALKGEKYRGDNGEPLRLVRTQSPERAPYKLGFPKADFSFPDALPWTVTRPNADSVVFRAETDAVVVERRYIASPTRFRLVHDITVENKTAQSQAHGIAIYLFGAQDPAKKGGGFLGYGAANLAEMVCNANGSIDRSNIESLAKKPGDASGAVRWIAADEKFFALALAPYPEAQSSDRRCGRRALDSLNGEAFLSLSPRTLAAHEKTTYTFDIFAGPKFRADLDAVRPGGEDIELAKLVNVNLAVLSRPLLSLLRFFHQLTGNWGISIIFLTLFVRLATIYPAHRALMSGKKMARLQPKLIALRAKYENDKERLAKETMALYKANGVNVLGGCLPMLIQMPIWIALYSTLNYAVELYRARFVWYIRDLSAPDPHWIAPGIMGVVMFIQMRMSPAGADPQQQKVMSFMMPIMFTGFSLFLPSGLAIYTLTSYLLGIMHQLFVNHLDKRARALAPA